MTRRESRICVFELLYEADFHLEIDPLEIYVRSLEAREAKGSDFAKSLYALCALNLSEIDKTISENAENWKITRMSAVTKAILRMAVGEMLYTDVPPKACINEAVEIAKKYEEPEVAKFINGILGSFLRGEVK